MASVPMPSCQDVSLQGERIVANVARLSSLVSDLFGNKRREYVNRPEQPDLNHQHNDLREESVEHQAFANDQEINLKKLALQLNKVEESLSEVYDVLVYQLEKAEISQLRQTVSLEDKRKIPPPDNHAERWPLPLEDYRRYSRQLILPEIGVKGQLALRRASALVIGLGGLGCPAATYLARAGIGTIGLADGDRVEATNLHRQPLHDDADIGKTKVLSALESLCRANPTIRYIPEEQHITPQTAVDLIRSYDVVLDCTDHPTSRYLISDACVILGKPLVTAAALKTDGQLMILNNPPRQAPLSTREDDTKAPQHGPCYRCVFPKPPPTESQLSCGESGILGPVVGIMGVMQALYAIQVLTRSQDPLPPASLQIFSAYGHPPFRTVKLRPPRPDCTACSINPNITLESLSNGSVDYVRFCGIPADPNILLPAERVSVAELAKVVGHNGPLIQRDRDTRGSTKGTLILDVRERSHFDICNLPGSLNVPFSELQAWERAEDAHTWDPKLAHALASDRSAYFICANGNDSQLAVRRFIDLGLGKGRSNEDQFFGDVVGGFRAWRTDVDPRWPEI